MPDAPRTLADLKNLGRDPLVMFRADEALALDPSWLARVVVPGEPLGFWDDDEDDMGMRRQSYTREDGVAVYAIEGPLTQRGWMCFQGYDSIERDVRAMAEDPEVSAIMLRINSPGGVCAGCFEGAKRMRAAIEASGKPCTAYVDEMAYSAGYALAVIADDLVVPEPGGVGSVGVIASLQSVTRKLAADGVDVRILTSGAEKGDGHPALPLSDKAVARTQARVDELGAIFQRWVAARRGIDPGAVKALEAGVRYGHAAVAAGLADRVASYSDALASLRERALSPSKDTDPMNTKTDPTTPSPAYAALRGDLARALNLDASVTDAELVAAASTSQKEAAQVPALREKLTVAEKALADRDAADLKAAHKAVLDKHVARGALTKADLDDADYMATLNALAPAAADKILSRRPGLPTQPVGTRKVTAIDPEQAAIEPTVEALSDEERELAEIAGLSPEALVTARKDEQRQAARRQTGRRA